LKIPKEVIRGHKSKKAQLPKERGKTMIFKTLSGKVKIEATRISLQTGNEHM
jgi:hypothetical protein